MKAQQAASQGTFYPIVLKIISKINALVGPQRPQ
jgi:hypothetical protein